MSVALCFGSAHASAVDSDEASGYGFAGVVARPAFLRWDRAAIAGLESTGLHGPAALATLAGRAGSHAAILGLDDTFRLAAFVWLARPVRPDPAALREPNPRRTALEDWVEEP